MQRDARGDAEGDVLKSRTPFAKDAAAVICSCCPMSLMCLMGRPPGDAFYCKKCKGFSIPDAEVTVCCTQFRGLYRKPTHIQGGTMYGFDERTFKGTIDKCGACRNAWNHVRGIL